MRRLDSETSPDMRQAFVCAQIETLSSRHAACTNRSAAVVSVSSQSEEETMQHNGSRWIGVFGTALAVLGIAGASWVNTAAAASGSAVSPLALPIAGLLTCDDRAGSSDASAAYSAGFAAEPPPAGSSDQYSRWRPRRDRGWREPVYRDRYRDQSRREGFVQSHAGFLGPDGPQEAGLVLGYRMGFNGDQ